MSVTWRHSPSIFLLFSDSHQHWTWIASRSTASPSSSICMQRLLPLHAHNVEQQGQESIVAINARLLISRLAGEIWCSVYWCASGSVQRTHVPNTHLPNAFQR